MESLINIRALRPEDVQPLNEAAKADGHGVWFPNAVIEKNGKIVGYLSVNAIPIVLSWQDSKEMGAADSLKEIGFIEGLLATNNAPAICIPCDPDSPYMKFLPKNGYEMYSKPVHLWFKTKGGK